MADGGEPYQLHRSARASRFWFISPGLPQDYRTFLALCEAALTDAREDLLTNPRAAQLLALIGKHGREGHTLALQGEISAVISRRLAFPDQRQRVRDAHIAYHCVPLPKAGRLEGVAVIRAWRHTLRTTFDPVIGK